jgi:hypothetical protein
MVVTGIAWGKWQVRDWVVECNHIAGGLEEDRVPRQRDIDLHGTGRVYDNGDRGCVVGGLGGEPDLIEDVSEFGRSVGPTGDALVLPLYHVPAARRSPQSLGCDERVTIFYTW